MSGSPLRSLSIRFPHRNPVHTSPLHHTRYVPRASHSSRFNHLQNSGRAFGVAYKIIIVESESSDVLTAYCEVGC
jgi:hypothetical protein